MSLLEWLINHIHPPRSSTRTNHREGMGDLCATPRPQDGEPSPFVNRISDLIAVFREVLTSCDGCEARGDGEKSKRGEDGWKRDATQGLAYCREPKQVVDKAGLEGSVGRLEPLQVDVVREGVVARARGAAVEVEVVLLVCKDQAQRVVRLGKDDQREGAESELKPRIAAPEDLSTAAHARVPLLGQASDLGDLDKTVVAFVLFSSSIPHRCRNDGGQSSCPLTEREFTGGVATAHRTHGGEDARLALYAFTEFLYACPRRRRLRCKGARLSLRKWGV